MPEPDIHDIDKRVAVLEQIARDTATALSDIRADLRGLRSDLRDDFRWLLRVMLGGFITVLGGFITVLGVMAHGFKWL